MAKTASAVPGRLSTPAMLAFAVGNIPAALLTVLLSTYVPRFYAGHIGVGMAVIGGAIATVRLIDVGLDLLLGWSMDRTRTRFGRYRVWYVAALPVLALATFMLLNPPEDAGASYLMVWLFILYAGLSTVILSHSAWAAAMATDYHERSRIYGWIHVIAAAGAITLLAMPAITGGAIKPGEASSMPALAWIVILALPLTGGVALFTTRERVAPTQSQDISWRGLGQLIARPDIVRLILADLFLALGPGLTQPIFIFFFHNAKGYSVAQASLLLIPLIAGQMIGAPIWPQIARRMTKHRALQLATVAYGLSQATVVLLPPGVFGAVLIGNFVVGICSASFYVLVRAMIADAGDEIRLDTGQERTGMLYALIVMTQKIGGSISVSIVFPILAVIGYNPRDGAVNTPEALRGLELCYLIPPLVLVLLAACMFFGYRLDETRHAEVRALLDERDALAASDAPGSPAPAPSAAASAG